MIITLLFFFFNDTATTEIYTLSLHDALPIAGSAMGTPRPGGPATPDSGPGARTGRCGWWWPPPTRPGCPNAPPGIWSPTGPCPTATATPRPRPRVTRRRCRRPTWPRSCAATGYVTGSSRATSRSKTNWAGPTSRSAPTPRSADTTPWCAARSVSVGRPGSPTRHPRWPPPPAPASRAPAAERGGTTSTSTMDKRMPIPRWPVTLRRIRSWLTPATLLQRYWQAWSHAPPPPQLQDLITATLAGHPTPVYLPP